MNCNTILIILLVFLAIGLYVRELRRTMIIEYYPPGSDIVYKCTDQERYSSDDSEDRLFVVIIKNNGESLGRYEARVDPKVKSFNLEFESGIWFLEDSRKNRYKLTRLGTGMEN